MEKCWWSYGIWVVIWRLYSLLPLSRIKQNNLCILLIENLLRWLMISFVCCIHFGLIFILFQGLDLIWKLFKLTLRKLESDETEQCGKKSAMDKIKARLHCTASYTFFPEKLSMRPCRYFSIIPHGFDHLRTFPSFFILLPHSSRPSSSCINVFVFIKTSLNF